MTEYTTPAPGAELERLQGMTPWANPRYSFSDVGNAYLFADMYRDVARYASDRACWYVYTGQRWERDPGALRVMGLCRHLALLLPQLAPLIADADLRERFTANVLRWRTRRLRETILKDAAGVFPVMMDQFDRDPLLLNCLNGTLNIRSRTLHPHDPADMITRMADVAYDPDAPGDDWDAFISQICALPAPEAGFTDLEQLRDATCAASEKAAYLQKALGCAISGDTRHERMHVLYGPSTRNGKSTLVEAFAGMLGDYAVAAMPETLAAQAYATGRGPSEDLARLAGARFFSLAEPDKALRLSPSLIKQLTGNDTITCRFLHENSFQYRPCFKLFLNANHLPSIGDGTVFRSDRVQVIPFERHFTAAERDPDLKRALASPVNRAAILNWALDGFSALTREGFDPPHCILAASASYREQTDVLGQFMQDCLVPQRDHRLRTADVYRAYRDWCDQNGFRSENAWVFRHQLEQRAKIAKAKPRGSSSPTSVLFGYDFSGIA